ncbi:MAG: site-specific integrase [Alcaligenaceae bacterium]|nr:MAG: site-specific integrase [Alcaligenaceae bacterium]
MNAKLIRIYYWLAWMQKTNRVRPGLIGISRCPVISALGAGEVQHGRVPTSDKFPLLLRLKARKSKHDLPKFRPDESTLDALTEHFQGAGHSAHVAHRNCLMASIAAYTGFRRGSIQSLTVSQFEGDDYVETDRNSVLIKPKKQKFGYGDIYEIPTWLHEQIRNFISEYRSQVLIRCRAGARAHKNHVFISDRDGKPLTERAITALMSKALRALNAPKGFAIHLWRGKFAADETAEQYERRSELGLDTSILTMDSIIARTLGHKNLNSARPYTSEYEAAEVARRRALRDNERGADKKRILELEEQVRLLKALRDQK